MAKNQEKPSPEGMWLHFAVELQVDERIVGGIPRSEKLIEPWLGARAPKVKPEEGDSLEELASRVAEEVQASIEQKQVGFKRDAEAGVVYIEARQIKAMLKEAANILRSTKDKAGFINVVNAKSKLAERMFVTPPRIVLGPIDAVKMDQRVVHAMTAQGPRSSLKEFEYFEGAVIRFNLRILNDRVFGEADLRALLDYSQYNGLGADRSQGEGVFTILRCEQVGTPAYPER